MKMFSFKVTTFTAFLFFYNSVGKAESGSQTAFDNANFAAFFAAIPLKVFFHESGHYLGIKYLTDSEVYSFKYRIFAGRVSANPEKLNGFADASAAVLPAMASDRFLTQIPYDHFFIDGVSFSDKVWRWLKIMQIWPAAYMATDLISIYTDGGGGDWVQFVRVWRGREWSSTHTYSLWGIASVLFTDFWINQRQEVTCLLGEIYHFSSECSKADKAGISIGINGTALALDWKF